MPKVRGENLAWNLILFISGILLSSLFSAWVGNLVSRQYIFLAAVLVLLALIVVFFISRIYKRLEATERRIEKLCSQAVSVVDYYDEPYLKDEGIEYRGIVFQELTELVRTAEKEILVLGATRPREKPYIVSDHEERKFYHRTIEDKIKANIDKDFRYIRITQVSQLFAGKAPKEYLGSTLLEHYKRISKLKKDCENLKATIAILSVPIQYLTSIWFIDGTSIVIEITGMTDSEHPYPSGLIRITDKGGNISAKFKKLFDELQRKGHPIKL